VYFCIAFIQVSEYHLMDASVLSVAKFHIWLRILKFIVSLRVFAASNLWYFSNIMKSWVFS